MTLEGSVGYGQGVPLSTVILEQALPDVVDSLALLSQSVIS